MNDNDIILILGGARSGKSSMAVTIAGKLGKNIVYIATGSAGDDEMEKRIEAHKLERPPLWKTVEARTDIGNRLAAIDEKPDAVILDCLTMLTTNILLERGEDSSEDALTCLVTKEIDELFDECGKKNSPCIVVSNEVGMGIVPVTGLGRLFRDTLGRVNKHVAAKAGKVLLMVAGIAVDIKKLHAELDNRGN